jgi:hypothetical protein
METQRIFVNELSVSKQAANDYEAGDIINCLAHTLRELIKHGDQIGCEVAISTSANLANMRLLSAGPDSTFHACLFKRRGPDQQAVSGLLQQLLRKRPSTEELLARYAQHRCAHHRGGSLVDVARTSVAAAAALEGWLVSLYGCMDFPRELVTVRYCQDDNSAEHDVVIIHFIEQSDIYQVRRVYEASDKHKPVASQNSGVHVSSMELDQREAQKALDRAVSLPDEKRVFSLYNRKIYVFFEHTERHYHGYLVQNPREYQNRDGKIYSQLHKLGWINLID